MRAFDRARRMLAQTFQQKVLLLIEEREIDGRSAQIDSGNDSSYLVIGERLDAGSGMEVIHHFHFLEVDHGNAAVAVIRHQRGLAVG